MVFTYEEYKRCIGNILTSTDGHKYVGTISIQPIHHSDSEDSGDDIDESSTNTPENKCAVCLSMRTTWIFMPCRHAKFCSECSRRVIELGKTCPICRSNIDTRLEIFTN